MTLSYLKLVIFSFLSTALLVPVLIFIAKKIKIESRNKLDRWSKQDKPLLGGVAVWLVLSLIGFLVLDLNRETELLIAISSIIFLLGLIDDILGLNPAAKLVVQFICAALVVKSGFILNFHVYPLLNVLITVFWIVLVTNSFNLIDNMDGLLSGIAAVIGFIFFLYFSEADQTNFSKISVLVSSVSLGFLIYNFPPSKIFMGDAGSLYLGFLFSVLAVKSSAIESPAHISSKLLPFFVLAVPLFDTFFVVVTRLLQKSSFLKGGKDHISHRLVQLGISEKRTNLFLYTLCFAFGMIALFYRNIPQVFIYALAGFIVIVFYYLGFFLFQESENKKETQSTIISLKRYLPIGMKQLSEVMTDIILVSCSFYVGVYFHYEGDLSLGHYEFLKYFLPWIIVVRLAAFIFVGLYQGVWKYIGFYDVFTIGSGALLGSLGLLIVYYVRYAAYHVSISPYFFFFEFLLTFMLVSGSRCGWRILWQTVSMLGERKKKVVIVGTDFNGLVALKNIKENERKYEVVGFISTNSIEVGARIQGVSVLGSIHDLPSVFDKNTCDEIIYTQSSANYKKIEETCRSYNIPIRQYEFRVQSIV